MKKLIASLSPAEQSLLNDPNFITEDEADLIVCGRREDEPTVAAEDALAEFGYSLRGTRA